MVTAEKTRKRAQPAEDLEQKEFAGMESKKIPALSKAARAYKAAQKERMEALEVEVSLKEKLIELMHKHEAEIGSTYRDKDIIISLNPGKESIKVKSPSDDSEEAEDDGEGDE